MTMKSKTKKTDGNFELWRAKASCRIGRDALDGKIKMDRGVEPMEYAIYNLLHAVEEIAIFLGKKEMEGKVGKGKL